MQQLFAPGVWEIKKSAELVCRLLLLLPRWDTYGCFSCIFTAEYFPPYRMQRSLGYISCQGRVNTPSDLLPSPALSIWAVCPTAPAALSICSVVSFPVVVFATSAALPGPGTWQHAKSWMWSCKRLFSLQLLFVVGLAPSARGAEPWWCMDPLPVCVCPAVPVQQGGGTANLMPSVFGCISQLLGLSRVSIQTLQAILTCSQGAEGTYGPLNWAVPLQTSQCWSLYGLEVFVDDPGMQGIILRSLYGGGGCHLWGHPWPLRAELCAGAGLSSWTRF